MMPLSERQWDPRLWHNPTLTDLWASRRRPRTQIRCCNGQDCGVRYDPLNGTLCEADNGHKGRPLDAHEAAERLGLSVTQVRQWIRANNAMLRREYQATD